MKILGRCSRVAHLHIVLGTQLQKPFQSGTGVFRPEPFQPVGQQQPQTTEALPLGLAAGNKQVNHGLCVVDKIAELGFPKRQPHRLRHGIPVLKSKNTHLGQQAVVYRKCGLRLAQVIQRYDIFSGFSIHQNAVALAEGSTSAVLSAQANRNPFD